MTQYQGNVQSYVLEIQSANSRYDQKAVISLHGLSDWRFSISCRRMGNSERTKNALGRKSSISIIGWIPGRISPTCCATRSWCTSCTTILATRLKSEAFPQPFLVGQCASPTGSSKPISFHEKIAKTISLNTAKALNLKIHPELLAGAKSLRKFGSAPEIIANVIIAAAKDD